MESSFEIGYFFGNILGYIALAAAWVIVIRLIPPLKRDFQLAYGGGFFLIAVAWIKTSPPRTGNSIAFVIAAAILYWQYRRLVPIHKQSDQPTQSGESNS